MMALVDARSRWKNGRRAEGAAGASGIVLSMDMVSTNYYAVAYTVPVQVGASQQNFSLQVDTGSSDLWIASKSCSSSSCSATSGRLYDPSSSQSTGATFTMQYLSGNVDGPIVWDRVQIGDYVIPNQALAAATTVDNEPLSYSFDGILGLALPLNSLIQQIIPGSTSDAPDGAAISSNLFSLTPASDAPSQPFFSLTLARPGSSQTPSLLGIGRHPPEIVPDPSQIRYSHIVSEEIGTLFWKTTVRAITVYANGQVYPVALQSLSGAPEPTAIMDSGLPLIITTPALANGIYGALGIGPAPDGNYYVPCATPLNMTITLDGQNELPLHPLDLTTEPAGQSSAQYCLGLIQTDPSQLTATSDIGDMILGVPFLRNVYTVLAYEQPDATGNFNGSVQLGTRPTLGLLGLTNATQAMDEFERVRVLKQPLGGSGTPSPSPDGAGAQDGGGGGSQLSVGIKVLIGLAGCFALCVALFALRYVFARRRWRRTAALASSSAEAGSGLHPKMAYLGASSRRSSGDQSMPLYDAAAAGAIVKPLHKDAMSEYTVHSGRTCVADDDYYYYGTGLGYGYAGVRSTRLDSLDSPSAALDVCDPWDPYADRWRDTIVGTDAGTGAAVAKVKAGDATSLRSYFSRPDLDLDFDPCTLGGRVAEVDTEASNGMREGEGEGEALRSPGLPESPDALSPRFDLASSALLGAHERGRSDDAEFGVLRGSDHCGPGMAGVGTAARGSVIDVDFQRGSGNWRPSMDSFKSNTPLRPTSGSSSLRTSRGREESLSSSSSSSSVS